MAQLDSNYMFDADGSGSDHVNNDIQNNLSTSNAPVIVSIGAEDAPKFAPYKADNQIAESTTVIDLDGNYPTNFEPNVIDQGIYLDADVFKTMDDLEQPPITLHTWHANMGLAKVLISEGNYVAAHQALNALMLPHAEAHVHCARSLAYMAENISDLALEEAEKALSYDIKCKEALYIAGILLAEKGDSAKAFKYLVAVEDLGAYSFNRIKLYVILSDLAADINNHSAALVYINKAYKMAPHNALISIKRDVLVQQLFRCA